MNSATTAITPASECEDDYATNENYYLYKQDIMRFAVMGVKYYSFSISWARILPFELPGTPVNSDGLNLGLDCPDVLKMAIQDLYHSAQKTWRI